MRKINQPIRLFALLAALHCTSPAAAQPSDDDILVPMFLTFEGLGEPAIAVVPSLRFDGLAADTVTAPPLRFQGLQSSVLTPERLVFSGLGNKDNVRTPALAFDGIGTAGITLADAVVFIGLGSQEGIEISALFFTGLSGHAIKPQPVSFVGLGDDTARELAPLSFVGLASDDMLRAPSLRFTGVRPPDPILTVEDFSGGSDGWFTNDGPQALQLNRTEALCLFDNQAGDLTLFLPAVFLGDWGGPTGSFAFRVYYQGTTQWPVVITLHSPTGTAVYRESLNSYNDQPFEDLSRPLSAIWWEENGNWDQIIANVTTVSISLDIKDGYDNTNEVCVDDFVLTRVPRL